MQDRLHPGILGLIWMQLRLRMQLIDLFKRDVNNDCSQLASHGPDRQAAEKVSVIEGTMQMREGNPLQSSNMSSARPAC